MRRRERRQRMLCLRVLGLASALAVAGAARAGDGALEINQTCATSTAGCFAGDVGGAFPVEIVDPPPARSFVLTSDLVLPNGVGAIRISTSSLAIDLNGFAIVGPVACSGTPPVCSGSSAHGIGVDDALLRAGITVRGGTVTGTSTGLSLGIGASVRDVRAIANLLHGIAVGDGSRIERCVSAGNGGAGASTGSGAVQVVSSAFCGNGGTGLSIGFGSLARGNAIYENGRSGIASLSRSELAGNAVLYNGSSTGDAGIECAGVCLIQDNAVRSNVEHGIDPGTGAFAHNTVTANDVAPMTSGPSPQNLGGNHCAGTGTVSATCP